MSHEGSYHVDSFASNTDAEIRRLNAQVDLFWPVESEVLLRHGLRDGMRVLDCGCGPGRLLERLKQRLPGIACTGVEIDPLLVETARQRMAEAGMADCTISQGSAEQPGLPPESFDFITLRLVLEHVPDPVAALKSLATLLRPGGRLAVISNDFDFHLRTWPAVVELDPLYDAYCASRRKDGGDPCIGRRVPRLMIEAGLNLVGCEIELAHNAMLGDGPFLKAEGAGIPAQLVKSGFLAEEILEAMTRSWRTMLGTPEHSIVRPLWVAVGERAAENRGQKAEGSSRVAESVDSPTVPPPDTPSPGPPSPVASPPCSASPTDSPTVPPPPAAPLPPLLAMLVATVAEVLERDDINPDDSMAALGLDSISAMFLQERLREQAGVEIPVVRFLEDEPVKSLLAFLPNSLGAQKTENGKASVTKEADRWEEGEL